MKSTSVMLVTKRLSSSPSGGREMLTKLNHDCLKDLFGDRLTTFEIEPRPIRGLSVIQAIRGHIDGITDGVLDGGIRQIVARNVTKVFVDGSNLGQFVFAIKPRFPKLQVWTFFNNVEVRFFLGSFRTRKTPHALG